MRTKFSDGAWIVLPVIPLLIGICRLMRSHYDEVAATLSLDPVWAPPVFRHTVLILVGHVHRGVVRAVAYATSLAPDANVRGLFVETDLARTAHVEERWARCRFDVLPEFLPRRWWHHVLHNQTALMVKAALLFVRTSWSPCRTLLPAH